MEGGRSGVKMYIMYVMRVEQKEGGIKLCACVSAHKGMHKQAFELLYPL